MNIAVLGAGIIGTTLGKKWLAAGHHVQFSSREPDKADMRALLESLGERASAGLPGDTIAFGDVVVFAVPGRAMQELVSSNVQALSNKVLIDTTNNVGQPAMNSLATIAAQVPSAHAFRAFNSLGWENFENPQFDGVPADLFFCGPAGDAKTTVEALIGDVGLRPVYVGGLEQADVVDALARLWFALSGGQKLGRHLAFKMLR